MYKIGVDLGGTKIEAVLLNNKGEELQRKRVATPQGNYSETLESIRKIVAALEASQTLPAALGPENCSVGIGAPGAISSHSGKMKNCNSTCLNQRDFLFDIQKLLQREVRIANDADCFALSEAIDGAAAGKRAVFGVILGTGVGGGIVIDQRVLAGPNAIAGEWGHNPLPVAALKAASQQSRGFSRSCYCGRCDCIETYLSGPGLAMSYFDISARQASGEEIVALAESGDKEAAGVLEIYCQQLAVCLAQVINILDPDVIVLGGGLSKISRLYERVPQLWQQYIFTDQVLTRLKPAKFGDASGVRGAAQLWP